MIQKALISILLLTSVMVTHAALADSLPIYKQPAGALKLSGPGDGERAQVSPKPGWRALPEHRTKEHTTPWWAHALLWIPNRLLDLIDVFRVDVGVGPAIGGVVRVTRHGQLGYRRMAPFSLRLGDFGRSSPIIIETDDEQGAGSNFRQSEDRIVCNSEIGLGVDLGLGAYAGICSAEILDFFAGLVFVDLEGDDIR